MDRDLSHVLGEMQIAFSMDDAQRFLKQVLSVIDYLVVYQHYFPKEYMESMRLVCLGQSPLLPQSGEAYSPHEAQLLKLVDQHLFPLPLWYALEDACEENRCTTIPIEPIGFDRSTGDDFLEMDLGWQLLFYLTGEVEANFFAEAFKDERDALFAIPIEAGPFDGDVLREICERQGEPLAFFFHAIDLLNNDTGTIWLDATREMICDDAAWDIEIIDVLAREYDEAHTIKERSDQFMNWLESDLIPHFTEVVRIWNETMILSIQRRQLVQPSQ